MRRLVADGHEVCVFDANPASGDDAPPAGVTFVRGDITDRDAVRRLVSEGFDTIFHLAAVVGVGSYVRDPLQVLDVNVLGTRWVIDAAIAQRTPILYASTSEVFGKNPAVPWSETSDRVLGPPSVARWSYSSSKALAEHLLYAARVKHNLDFAIVRYFNLYGPGQEPTFVVPAMAWSIARGEAPVVYDGGDMTRCFTYIDDAVEATVRAARTPAAVGEAFNIGSMKETRIRELAAMLLRIAGREDLGVRDVRTSELYGSRYEDLNRRQPDTAKAERLLGWTATTPLEKGLERTYAYFQRRRAISGGA